LYFRGRINGIAKIDAMRTDFFEIQAYHDKFREQVISVWEQSVLATHDFLAPHDFEKIKTIVKGIDFTEFSVFCLVNQEKVTGFVGVAGKKVEMLFLEPGYFGKGLGKKLMEYAVRELKADEVDVNEQNKSAVAFYTRLGFETYDRMEKDSLGKNYPILKMKLRNSR